MLINAHGKRQRHGECVHEGIVPFSSCAVCQSINCSYREVPGLRLISQYVQSLCAQTPTRANPAWAHQGTAGPGNTARPLKISMPLHKCSYGPGCKPGFNLCKAGGNQWGIELSAVLPRPSVAARLMFAPLFKLLLACSFTAQQAVGAVSIFQCKKIASSLI